MKSGAYINKVCILCNPDCKNNVINDKQEKPDMITYFISLNVSLEMNSKQIIDLFFFHGLYVCG